MPSVFDIKAAIKSLGGCKILNARKRFLIVKSRHEVTNGAATYISHKGKYQILMSIGFATKCE